MCRVTSLFATSTATAIGCGLPVSESITYITAQQLQSPVVVSKIGDREVQTYWSKGGRKGSSHSGSQLPG